LNKFDKKLLKLQTKAEKCLTHEKARKILKKQSKILLKISEGEYNAVSGAVPPWPHENT